MVSTLVNVGGFFIDTIHKKIVLYTCRAFSVSLSRRKLKLAPIRKGREEYEDASIIGFYCQDKPAAASLSADTVCLQHADLF